MSHDSSALLSQLREALIQQRYNPEAVSDYCRNADYFLRYLAQRKITLEAVTPDDVSSYLHLAVRRFRKLHGRPPGPRWTFVPRAGIHALLRLVLKRWPPEPVVTAGELFCRGICDQYEQWLKIERGLAVASINALMWEARYFCAWYIKRSGTASFVNLNVNGVDAYMDMRAPGLTRISLKDVAERLRSLLKYLHKAAYTAINLAPHVIAPRLYAYEGIPSVLSPDQIEAVLEFTRRDRSPVGLRDYAILQLLATYGLRAGEVCRLRLDDIEWRAESLRIRRSKTGSHSLLPLLEPVGGALLDYLRHGRPETDVREIFVRTRVPYVPMARTYRAPHVPMVRIYHEVRRRIEAAGVIPTGKRGPHIFRHARAVSLLRASVPRKVIGDMLGHRSTESTIPYLKLAIEDLRAIALDIPGQEARS
jgi:site-specific recombinase XerD